MPAACKSGSVVITSDNRRCRTRLTRPAAAVSRTRTSSSISLPFPLQLFRIPAPAAAGPFLFVSPLRTAAPAHTTHRLETRSATHARRVHGWRPQSARTFRIMRSM